MDAAHSTSSYKLDRPHHHHHRRRLRRDKLLFVLLLAATLLAYLTLLSPRRRYPPSTTSTPSWGGAAWEKRVRASALPKPISSSHGRRRRPLSVLVTGAAGFLGTHASLLLRRRGDGVLGLDSFPPNPSPLLLSRRSLLSRCGVFVVDGHPSDSSLLRKLLDVHPFTHLLHLPASPHSNLSFHASTLVSLLEAAKSADPPPSFIYASSTSVYHHAPVASESDRADLPTNFLAAAAKAAEDITHAYHHIYGLSVTALRLSSVYGPWGRPDSSYFSFTRDILRRRPLSLFHSPDDFPITRDFAYVDDVVRACVAALDTSTRQRPAQMRVYNLGSGAAPVPVTELVDVLERILKVKAERKAVRVPRMRDARAFHVNVTRAERELGYRPATDLKTGMKRFVRWYLEYYSPDSSSLRKIAGGRTGGISS